jgi:ATP-dependent helicase/nuclease subunit A
MSHKDFFDAAALLQATEVQAKALNPRRSIWISANAGTGKTEVLTRRLLALLLADATLEPRHILALTFTKAGASEMAERLPKRLAELATLGRNDPAALALRLKADLGLEPPENAPERLQHVLQQFYENPPVISTVHGLAQQMLARFPAEAGVPAGFSLLDDAVREYLLLEVQNQLLSQPDDVLSDALATLLDELGEHGWRDLSRQMIANTRTLKDIFAGRGAVGALADLRAGLGLDETRDAALPIVPDAAQMAALGALATENLLNATDVLTAPEALREGAWLAFLLTNEATPRKAFATKKLVGAFPQEAMMLQQAAEVAAEAVRQRKLWRQYEVTEALLLWAYAVQQRYAQRKREREALDFDDLLDALERLLDQTGEAAFAEWVWYALDRRFKHMVVDEAQDNNAQQTRIVQHLARNMLSGDVGEAAPRTVMAVGDVKQCIFYFQGARPDLFLNLREDLQAWSGGAFAELNLTHSFRSGPEVLRLVDDVFVEPDMVDRTTGDEGTTWPAHRAVAVTSPSRVEVWPLMEPEKAQPVAPWTLPAERREAEGEGDMVRLARQVARWLKARLAEGPVMPATGVPLRAEDVMIVVQRRKTAATFAGILRAEGVPVAGGGGVQAPVVGDAIALLRWVFNPLDTLSLLQVLKAFCGGKDADILALAARVRAAGGEGEPVLWHECVEGAALAWLAGYRALEFAAPVELVTRIAAETGSWDDLAPLMAEAEACATLRDVVERLELREQVEKPLERQADAADGVRILTAHGSKGLEAPLVILPETMRNMEDIRQTRIFWPSTLPQHPTANLMLIATDADLSVMGSALKEATKAQEKVNALRGLYVGLTRAADWLVVCGHGYAAKTGGTWYGLVDKALEREGWREAETPLGTGHVRGADFARAPETLEAAPELPLPLPPEPPVAAAWMEPDVGTAAQLRGDMVHALLQGVAVPDAPDDARAEATRVRGILPWLFGPESWPEVSVGLSGGILGRMDRLVHHEGTWWVIDFKTGEVPATMPAKYAAQVQGYKAALQAQFAGQPVRGAVVWTATAELAEI